MHHHPPNQERALNLSILTVSGPGEFSLTIMFIRHFISVSASSVLPHSIITGRFSWRFLCSTKKNRNVKKMKLRFVPKIILKFLNMFLELFPFVNPFLPLTNQDPVPELCTLLLAHLPREITLYYQLHRNHIKLEPVFSLY